MKKKLIIVFAVILVVLLLIPVKKVYEDGGTQTYTSFTYKVIVWKQLDGKTGTEFYFFPSNFHQLDYYEWFWKGVFGMDITGIKTGHLAGSQRSGKASSKKSWQLSDSLREKIIEYAKEDATQNVYMWNKFLALRKNEVAKVAPDRVSLMGKLNQAMSSGNLADMKKIREADERCLCILFGEPYEAEFQSEGSGSAVHVYDRNGDEILTYTAGVGWHEKESKAETEVHGALKAAYYDVFRAARQEINAGSGAVGMEVQSGFDARA